MEQQRLKVAIIGAGLNGLALALSLRKFGIKARIYERQHNHVLTVLALLCGQKECKYLRHWLVSIKSKLRVTKSIPSRH
ncbi:FAD-dependent monooxygenase [Vibrio splendidus]|uniref:FAD-dependent monooxygenase n=1 Tax=Vibrio splendidus TaxID=29497 RepID=UPI001F533A8E|nr:FAD-dependent monooxygenase [Vibrio splendidus]